ncbi:hypothetical protein HN011_002103 [Eciton burchellii]|nr:hypothetical protein HN011_002103 [Eciton burchellii]
MAAIAILINCWESYMPIWLRRLYRYGKFSTKDYHSIIAKLEVPKEWFKHFYIFAGPASTATLLLILYKYLFNGTLPKILFTVLDTLLGTSRQASVPAEDVLLVAVIFSIHCWKRMYESCYINVFSESKMHLLHYLIGFIHYMLLFVCIIGEAEGFVRGGQIYFSWNKLTSIKLAYGFMFLWLSYIQFKTNIILRNLRKSKHNNVVSYTYKMPCHGLFKYISAPLQLTEILMYLTLSVILSEASTFHYITFWVLVNQMECAILSHWWYQDTFKNYPKERKILLPYIW